MWEWRVFAAPDELGPLPGAREPARRRDDLYVVLDADLGLKLRRHGEPDARFELKRCLERAPEGPRLLEKCFEGAWPLDAGAAEDLRALVGRPVALPEARLVLVKKTIVKALRGPACGIERSELELGDRRVATVCVESPSLERCLEVGRALELEGREPSSYPEFLARSLARS